MADSNNQTLRILITGDGHPVAKGVLESLRRSSEHSLHIVGVDIEERGNSFDWVDKHYIVPAPDSNEFVEVVLDVCLKENIQLVIPWSDDEVEVFARESAVFNENAVGLLKPQAIEYVVVSIICVVTLPL